MTKVLRRLVLTSILAALAIVFGLLVKLTPGLNLEFPNGGSVFGIYTLPLVIIGILLGYKYGILGGLVYGTVSWMVDGYFIHWGSIFLDYLIPFALVGLSGAVFKDKALKDVKYLFFTFMLAFLLRWLCHGFAGVLFWAEYTPEGMNMWIYSFFIYNLPYVLSSSIISFIAALGIKKQLILLTQTLK